MVKLLTARGHTNIEVVPKMYFPDYDVSSKLENKRHTFEVKTDDTSYSNLFIEFKDVNRQTGLYKPSGLYHPGLKAMYYIYYSTSQRKFYNASVDSLKAYIASSNLEEKPSLKSDSKPWGYILPKKDWPNKPGFWTRPAVPLG